MSALLLFLFHFILRTLCLVDGHDPLASSCSDVHVSTCLPSLIFSLECLLLSLSFTYHMKSLDTSNLSCQYLLLLMKGLFLLSSALPMIQQFHWHEAVSFSFCPEKCILLSFALALPPPPPLFTLLLHFITADSLSDTADISRMSMVTNLTRTIVPQSWWLLLYDLFLLWG